MNRADPKWSCQQIILITAEAANDFGLFQNLPGMPNDLLADCRDMDATVGPLEKRRTEFFLEFVNLSGECGLADKQRWAACPKCKVSLTATRYSRSRKFILSIEYTDQSNNNKRLYK